MKWWQFLVLVVILSMASSYLTHEFLEWLRERRKNRPPKEYRPYVPSDTIQVNRAPTTKPPKSRPAPESIRKVLGR